MVGVIVAALAFFWWLVFVLLWAIFLFFTVAIARSKRRSGLLWGILACFIPGITIIVLLLMPSRE